MRICVNGTDQDVPDACTVADLLREIGLLGRPVAVEVDRNVVPYADHSTFVLEPGAVVECVTLVGGG